MEGFVVRLHDTNKAVFAWHRLVWSTFFVARLHVTNALLSACLLLRPGQSNTLCLVVAARQVSVRQHVESDGAAKPRHPSATRPGNLQQEDKGVHCDASATQTD